MVNLQQENFIRYLSPFNAHTLEVKMKKNKVETVDAEDVQ